MFLKGILSYPAPARLGLFLLTLLVIWLPFAIPIYLLVNHKDPNLTTILTMGLLVIDFIFLVNIWGRYVYNKNNLFKIYGLIWNQKNAKYLLKGLAIGFLFTWALFIVETIFGWIEFQPPSYSPIKLIFEGLASALAVGLGEELLFRGWLLDEVDRDYQPNTGAWIDALVFAILHFIRPISEIIRTIVTFPALVLLGLTLVWGKRSHDNLLGICIGLHGGLLWGYYILNVGGMLQYTEKVPSWITGIDNNPIAGIMGLLFLSILAVWMRKS